MKLRRIKTIWNETVESFIEYDEMEGKRT